MAHPPFDAFVSYRRVHPDSEVALAIQAAIESFRPPHGLERRTRLRAFVDTAELVAGGRLDERIRAALSDARYLVVVCSPEAARSDWVNDEVSSFVATAGVERVLPVLVAGAPEEAFPRALLGAGGGDPAACAPVAADLRSEPPSLRGSRRRLRAEKLRLLAPLLGCALDDLVRRDERRRRRRVQALAVVLLVAALSFAGIAAVALWQRQVARTQQALAEQRLREAITVAETMLFEVDDRLARVSGASQSRRELTERVAAMLERLELTATSKRDLQRRRVEARLRTGQLALSRGETESARRDLMEALHVAEQLHAASRSPDTALDVAHAHLLLGELASTAGDTAGAEAHRAILEDVVSAGAPADPLLRPRAVALDGAVLAHQGRLKEAEARYQAAIAATEATAAARPHHPDVAVDLANLHESLARIALREKDPRRALAHRITAAEILRAAAREEPADPFVSSNLATVEERLGGMAERADQPRAAEAHYHAALRLVFSLYLEQPENSYFRHALAGLWSRLGSLAEQRGDLAKATTLYTLDVEMSALLVEQDPSSVLRRRELVGSRRALLALLERRGDRDACEAHGRLLQRDVDRLLAAAGADRAALDGAADALSQLGESARRHRRLADAARHFTRALEISRGSYERSPDVDGEYAMLLQHANLALTFAAQRDLASARPHSDAIRAIFGRHVGDAAFEAREHVGRIRELVADLSRLGMPP